MQPRVSISGGTEQRKSSNEAIFVVESARLMLKRDNS